jgi:septal ring factor EnvC (AmiA/AmiB activator)
VCNKTKELRGEHLKGKGTVRSECVACFKEQVFDYIVDGDVIQSEILFGSSSDVNANAGGECGHKCFNGHGVMTELSSVRSLVDLGAKELKTMQMRYSASKEELERVTEDVAAIKVAIKGFSEVAAQGNVRGDLEKLRETVAAQEQRQESLGSTLKSLEAVVTALSVQVDQLVVNAQRASVPVVVVPCTRTQGDSQFIGSTELRLSCPAKEVTLHRLLKNGK